MTISVGDEEVRPAVIVKVHEVTAPGPELRAYPRHAGRDRYLLEKPAAQVTENPDVIHGRHHQVELAVPIEVGEIAAHGRDRVAMLAECRTAFNSNLCERAVAVVVVHVVLHGIVGDK